MSEIKDIHALLQLQAIVTQSTKNTQIMQEQLQKHIEQSQEQANYFIEQLSQQLPEKIIKPLNQCIHEAKHELKECPVQGKNYPCVKIYHDQPTFKGQDGHIYALAKP